jgi:hypothetical protein
MSFLPRDPIPFYVKHELITQAEAERARRRRDRAALLIGRLHEAVQRAIALMSGLALWREAQPVPVLVKARRGRHLG